jgi:soluble lytic murein transglycosylase-like protein
MGAFLSFLGGAGKAASDVAKKQIDANIERDRLELINKYHVDAQAQSLKMQDQYDQEKELRNDAKLLDPERAKLIGQNEVLKQAPIDAYQTRMLGDQARLDAVEKDARAKKAPDIQMNDADNAARTKQSEIMYAKSIAISENKLDGSNDKQLLSSINNELKYLDQNAQSADDIARREELLAQRNSILMGSKSKSNTVYSGKNSEKYDHYISNALKENGLSDEYAPYIKGIIAQESSFNPNAVGDGGDAVGLVQSHKAFANQYGINDRNDPQQSISGAVKAFSENLNKLGSVEKAIAAHNAGAGGVEKGVNNKGYVNSVLSYANQFKANDSEKDQQDNSAKSPSVTSSNARSKQANIYDKLGAGVVDKIDERLDKAETYFRDLKAKDPAQNITWNIGLARKGVEMLVNMGYNPKKATDIVTNPDFRFTPKGTIYSNGNEIDLPINEKSVSGMRYDLLLDKSGNGVKSNTNPIKDLNELHAAQRKAEEVN